jgi:hypothetical protein
MGREGIFMGVFLRDCPHCPASSVSFNIVWATPGPQGWRLAATCNACQGIVAAQCHGPHNQNPSAASGNIEGQGKLFMIGEMWPSRAAVAAPAHTPSAVASRFVDGEFNFQNGKWNAAVGMYRAALDLATKALQAPGATFFARLKSLHDGGGVTNDIWSWATHVRVDGNEALHDPDEFTKEDAITLRHFTTMFLRYVFEMRGLVEEYRKAKGSS